MKQMQFLIISLFLTSICYSQTTIKGKIENVENNEPIAYVNIGVVGKRIGTVSNNKGYMNTGLK